MTYSVTVALLFCGIATVVRYAMKSVPRIQIAIAACSAAALFVGVHVLLWLSAGYDAIATFQAAVENHKHIMLGARHETATRYVHFIIANLVVFFIAVGLPCAILWWSAVAQTFRKSPGAVDLQTVPEQSPRCRTLHSADCEPFRSFVWSALATLLVAASVPVYVLEVERVWMFLVPLIVIPIARQLFVAESGTGTIHATISVALLVAVQTIVTEILLTTYW
jgi:hypothetical protein